MIISSDLTTAIRPSNEFLNALLYDTVYSTTVTPTITYVFQGNGLNGGTVWSASGARTAFNLALQSWSDVIQITFIEAAGPYDGTGSTDAYDWIESFGTLSAGVVGEHDLPHVGTMTGTFSNDPQYFTATGMLRGGIDFATFVHEIGHGLGLLHPHNEASDPVGDPAFPGVDDPFVFGDNNLNQGPYTAMTYNSGYWEVGISPTADFGWEMGPGAFDIAALQLVYGANMATAAGASAYALPTANVSGTGWKAIWDAGGADEINAGNTKLDAYIDLREASLLNQPGGGGFVSRVTGVLGGVTIANGVVIENANGGLGDDRIHGNGANNVLDGRSGYDIVNYGGASGNLVIDLALETATGEGNDTILNFEGAIGGNGNDTLIAAVPVNAVIGAQDILKRGDLYNESFATALDLDFHFTDHTGDPTVEAGAGVPTVTVHANSGVYEEYYSFFATGTGQLTLDIDNTYNIDTIVTLYDEAGTLLAQSDDRDQLDGGSANYLDSFLQYNIASAGQRYFIVVSTFGTTNMPAGSAYDLNVSFNTSRIATGNFLLGSALYGGFGADTLLGAAGADTLDGGSGADSMTGGLGDDTYYVDRQDDLAYEDAGEGTDSVISSGSFYLWTNLENLTLGRYTGDNFGVGNDLDNTITGNEGSNLLLGGLGNDVLAGGDGVDSLFGEDGADSLNGNAGIDYLVGGAGDDTLNGGADPDALYGEDGNDTLNGGASFDTDILVGGAGDDVLFAISGQANPDYDLLNGAGGNDTYYVDTGDDLTFEGVGEGTDTVYANVTVPNAGVYLWANVENLVLQGTTAFGVGNELDNTMTGSASGNWLLGGLGNDTLSGKQGDDVLFGEGGVDTFIFEAGTGGDVIGDFQAGTDKISLVGYGLDFAGLQATFVQNGNVGGMLLANGDIIILHGVTMANLTASDFIFG